MALFVLELCFSFYTASAVCVNYISLYKCQDKINIPFTYHNLFLLGTVFIFVFSPINSSMNIRQQLESALASSGAVQQEAILLLTSQGETIELSDWVTVSEYTRRFNLESRNVVTNWIRRGVIPEENIRNFPELNIRLIKAVYYKEYQSAETV